jgi:hypothetical protein
MDDAELRLINTDGTGLRTIAKSLSQLLAWTPDGKHLAVNEFDALNLISIATGQKREILKGSQWKPTNGLRSSPSGPKPNRPKGSPSASSPPAGEEASGKSPSTAANPNWLEPTPLAPSTPLPEPPTAR